MTLCDIISHYVTPFYYVILTDYMDRCERNYKSLCYYVTMLHYLTIWLLYVDRCGRSYKSLCYYVTILLCYYVTLSDYLTTVCGQVWEKFHNDWIEEAWRWLLSVGLNEQYMHKSVHAKDKLAHYARACTDVYYTIRYYTILYYTILYYTILYYTILFCTYT